MSISVNAQVESSDMTKAVIKPTSVEIFLRKGEPLVLNITLMPQPVPLDLFILEDLSESFGNDIEKLRVRSVSFAVSELLHDFQTHF